jgi:hypothetical protein
MFFDHFAGFFRHLKHSGPLWKIISFTLRIVESCSFFYYTNNPLLREPKKVCGYWKSEDAEILAWAKSLEFIAIINLLPNGHVSA